MALSHWFLEKVQQPSDVVLGGMLFPLSLLLLNLLCISFG
jgi:hypothetical protein